MTMVLKQKQLNIFIILALFVFLSLSVKLIKERNIKIEAERVKAEAETAEYEKLKSKAKRFASSYIPEEADEVLGLNALKLKNIAASVAADAVQKNLINDIYEVDIRIKLTSDIKTERDWLIYLIDENNKSILVKGMPLIFKKGSQFTFHIAEKTIGKVKRIVVFNRVLKGNSVKKQGIAEIPIEF